MKFQYKKIGSSVFRPIIPVEIHNGTQSVQYHVLVDSGADLNVFDAEIGYAIGLDVKKGEKGKVFGIAGEGADFYIHQIQIKVGGRLFLVDAGFMPEPPTAGYGIVGQKGFFDIFVIKFDLLKKQIELKERDFDQK